MAFFRTVLPIDGRFWFVLWTCWSLVAVGALSAEGELERFLASVTTLSADFEQQVIDERGQVIQSNRGRFYLKRPGKFRWTYETPYRQEVVADGVKVWFYDPDLEQVTVKTIGAALGSAPALLLSGELDLEQRFIVSEQGRRGETAWVELRPKDEADVFRRLRVELRQGVLSSMELADNFGQLTRIQFEDVRLNPPLQDKLFRFSPPPGVDVFEG
ncbi:MAG: outer membrane lipoprotein chaperone LolA [Methylothermaceae bacterium]|nr:outer membrane lipoprotein chaperone LolA [Methylothermaceae bacterium]